MIAEKLKNNDEVEEGLKTIVEDYVSQKQARLLALKKGNITRSEFMLEAEEHIKKYIPLPEESRRELLDRFEEYVFGYSRLSVLIDDPDVCGHEESGKHIKSERYPEVYRFRFASRFYPEIYDIDASGKCLYGTVSLHT